MEFRFILYTFTLLLAFGNTSFSTSASTPAPTLLRTGTGCFIENADLLHLELPSFLIFVEESISQSDENDSDSQPVGPHNAALSSVPFSPAALCPTLLTPHSTPLFPCRTNVPLYLRNRVFRI